MSRKILSLTLSISLLFQYSGFAQTINLADYLSQGHNVVALDRFRPLALRYFSYEPSADNFKILLDKGDQKNLSDIKIKDEADKLLTYFKIGLTLPNEKFWVNLRPDAEDQIIDPELEKTDLGKVLLESDLQLKKDTSSLTSPQTKEGKAYWDKLYKKAGELFGTENITIPTITRPWIVPGEIIVRESKDSAYIYKAVLKVMLEEDYLRGMKDDPSTSLGARGRGTTVSNSFNDPRLKELNRYSTKLIKETILPELTKRINSSKDYASLRQVFFSLILARWFKDAFGSSGRVSAPENSYVKLINSQDLTNLTSKESWSKTAYFNEYKKSFNDGEYNLSEKIHTPTGQSIRRYTSGGGKLIFGINAPEVSIFNTVGSLAVKKDMFQITEKGDQKVGSPLVEDAVEGEQSLSAASSALGFFEGRKETLETMEDEINGMLERLFLPQDGSFTDEEIGYMRKVKYTTVDEILYAARKTINYWKRKINGNEQLFSDLELKLNAVAEKTYAKMEYSYEKMLERYFEKNKNKILKENKSPEIGMNFLNGFGEFNTDGKFELKENKIEEAMKYVNGERRSKYMKWRGFIGEMLELWYSWEDPVNEFMEVKQFIGEGKPLAEESQNKNISSSAVELKYKTDEFKNLLSVVLYVMREINLETSGNPMDKDLDLLNFKNTPNARGEIQAILEKIDSVLYLNGIRENVSAALAVMLSYKDAGRIDKEIEELKKLYASLNANILANRLAGWLTKSKLKEITTKDIKPIKKENKGHGLPVSYYVSRYHLLGAITVEGADYLVKVSHDEDNTDYKSGRRPHRIMELVPKDNPDTLEPLIRFRVFDDGIAAEISYAGHKEPKKKDSDEPVWKEAKRKAFSGLFNAKPQEIDRLQDFLVSEVKRILTAASAIVTRPESTQAAMLDGFGGIDLTQMNMLIQPQGGFASSSLDFSLPALSKAEIESFDLDKELELIQRMASSGIDPIDERLKKYLAVCFARGKVGKEIDELKLCLEDVFTAQQLDARQTPDGYKEVIVIADTRRYVLKESRLAAGKSNVINLN